MAVTRQMIEGQITAKEKKGITRAQAIEELLKGAEKGAGKAEKEVTLAQDALLRETDEAKRKELGKLIAREGRFASNERRSAVILKQIQGEEQP